MTHQQFIDYIENEVAKAIAILKRKNTDYANDDALSNFKQSGEFAGIKAHQSCMVLIGTKMSRLTNLLSKKDKPNNESIDDTLTDLINYLYILKAILNDDEIDSQSDDAKFFKIN